MYVCLCNTVTDRDIERVVRQEKILTFHQLKQAIDVATCCGKCASCAKKVMRATQREMIGESILPTSTSVMA